MLSHFLLFFVHNLVFDNVDIDDITKIALKWEQDIGLIRGGDISARDRRWAMGNSLTLLSSERVGDLAKELCEKARENSLDSTKDSPFAMLAKDNDIMWSGGKSMFSCHTKDFSFGTCIFMLFFIVFLFCVICYCVRTGMPDDCTVIVAHVVGRSANDIMNVGNQ